MHSSAKVKNQKINCTGIKPTKDKQDSILDEKKPEALLKMPIKQRAKDRQERAKVVTL